MNEGKKSTKQGQRGNRFQIRLATVGCYNHFDSEGNGSHCMVVSRGMAWSALAPVFRTDCSAAKIEAE